MSASKIGVVLSSGGGRGVFGHTGFMAALEALGVQVSASCGCSAGAVVGGLLASGLSVQDWVKALTHVRTEQYWAPRSSWQLFYSLSVNKGRGLRGLSDTGAAVRFLSGKLLVETFQECIYPFSAVAVNLGTGEEMMFHEGPLALGMMASAAMPGLYDPVEIEGQYFTDGGVINLAPAEAICCRHDLDVLLVHHVAQRDYSSPELLKAFEQPWTILNILHRLVYRRRPWYATGQPRSIHPCPCGCKAIVVVVEPELPELVWPLVSGGASIIDAAQSHAVAQLRPILQSLRAEPRTLLE